MLRTRHQALAWLTGIAALALYTATAAPGIVELFDDSLEFQLVGPSFGIAHPTGYPLYVMLSGLWSRVLFPFGNWAWRMNLFSALAAAAAIYLLTLLAQRLVTGSEGKGNLWAGLGAAVTLGLAPTWQRQATVAEVYTLHILLATAILYVAIGMDASGPEGTGNRPGAPVDGARRQRFSTANLHLDWRMALLCALIGLGLAHHRTIALLLPPLALYLLWSTPALRRPRRAWLGWILAGLLPLLLYLYLPLRAAAGVRDLHGSYTPTWQGFWRHILATGYISFFSPNPISAERTLASWRDLFVEQVGLAGLLLAVCGLAWLFTRRGRLAKAWILIALLFGVNTLFVYFYRVPDIDVFLLPSFMTVALFTAAGIGLAGRMLARWPAAAHGVQALLVVIVASGWVGRGPIVNRSQEWETHDYAALLAGVDFPPGSQVVGLEGEITALKYMQQSTGQGRNAVGIVADEEAARIAAVEASVSAGHPTYLTRELAGIETRYRFSGAGPLVRVAGRGEPTPAPPNRLEIPMAEGKLRLEGYNLRHAANTHDRYLQITLYWRPLAQLSQVLKVSLRLLDPEGNPLLWPDGAPVVSDQFPLRQVSLTSDWPVGEVVEDDYLLRTPTVGPATATRLLIVVYDAKSIAEVGRWETELPTSAHNFVK
jgi:hypothetical protein